LGKGSLLIIVSIYLLSNLTFFRGVTSELHNLKRLMDATIYDKAYAKKRVEYFISDEV
jgi:hypothetical protein